MNYFEKIDFEVNKLSFNELIPMCNEIYDWKHKTGELDKDATLRVFAKRIDCNNLRDVENSIMRLCGDILQKPVLLLFEEQTYNFLKHIK